MTGIIGRQATLKREGYLKRVEDGTHNWLGGEMQRELELRTAHIIFLMSAKA